MGKRLRIGLIFNYRESWIAGAYYILNLINALNTLKRRHKPELIIFHQNEVDICTVKKSTHYPFLKFINYKIQYYSLPERFINKIWRILFHRNRIDKKLTDKTLDVLFPNGYGKEFKDITKRIHWIPDFQEHYYPEYFSEDELFQRKKYQKSLSETNEFVIFSSQNALDDYNRLYPKAKTKNAILNFAVSLPINSSIDIQHLKDKYNISLPYFICPNQFWRHKNHTVVLRSLIEMKDIDNKFQVLFTGKESDYRNQSYYQSILDFIKKNDLKNIRILGFIPREDLVSLIKHSIAVIQPSFFEGWSTVVEDAKALNKFVIASDIGVHREQLVKNAIFFDPNAPQKLSKIISQYIQAPPHVEVVDYERYINEFGSRFIQIVNEFNIHNAGK